MRLMVVNIGIPLSILEIVFLFQLFGPFYFSLVWGRFWSWIRTTRSFVHRIGIFGKDEIQYRDECYGLRKSSKGWTARRIIKGGGG